MIDIEALFPALAASGYTVTSPANPAYICIAWAAGDDQSSWWPDRHFQYRWPRSAPRSRELSSFVRAFRSIGYEPCSDGSIEAGFEKVALFVDSIGYPTHAARQLSSGNWTSKLGNDEDIEHVQVSGVAGKEYGHVAQYLRREVA